MAGTLSLLGVDFGTDLIGANDGNPRGHFELTAAVELNDVLLRRTFGSRWKLPFRLPPNWRNAVDLCRLPTAQPLEFPAGHPCGIKDPRMCRLIPIWLELLAQRNLKPHFVVALRPPAEVAASLERRDGLSPADSRDLWLEHLAAAERDTRAYPRTFITMEALLSEPDISARRLALFLSLPEPNSSRLDSIHEFLDGNLRHHNAVDRSPVSAHVDIADEFYDLLTQVASGAMPDDEAFRLEADQLLLQHRDNKKTNCLQK
ncbi:MAG TPA: hypothetical protein VIM48_00615 [Chthoniobacterales bacterium]